MTLSSKITLKNNENTREKIMLKKTQFLCVTLICMSSLAHADNEKPHSFTPPEATTEEISKLLNFLTADRKDNGLTYKAIAGELAGKTLPLSFSSSPDYWGD